MRTFFTFLLFLILSANQFCAAQTQIPNNGFEEWELDTVGSIGLPTPIGFTTSNFLVNAGANQTVFMTDDAAVGEFAAKMVSDTSVVPPPFGTGELDTIAGFVALGIVNQINPGGNAFTGRPDSMSVWIKGTVVPGDTSSIQVILTRFDAATQTGDTIANAGRISMTITDNIYKKVTVPIIYESSEMPDSIKVRMATGGPRGGMIFPGNEFYVDDIQLIYMTSATSKKNAPKQTVRTMPNPMTEQAVFEFENPGNGAFDFVLINNNGQVVREIKNISGTQLILQREGLNTGIYYFTFSNKNEVVYSGKLAINK